MMTRTTTARVGRAFGGATGRFLPVVDVMEVIRLCIEYRQVAEAEETKRQHIRAQAAVAIARIRANRDALLHVIENTARERRASLDAFLLTSV